MDSCSLSWSTSYFAEIARPSRVLALSPFCKGNFTSFSAFASSACSGSSYFCAQPWGTAKAHATRNATAIVVFLMFRSPRLWLVGAAMSSVSTLRRVGGRLIRSINQRIASVTLDTRVVNRYTSRDRGGSPMEREQTPRRVPIRELVRYYLRLGLLGFGGPVAVTAIIGLIAFPLLRSRLSSLRGLKRVLSTFTRARGAAS